MGVNAAVNTLMNLLFNASMSMMISLIKQLQIIVHMIMFRAAILPGNTAILFSQLIGILTFDPIEVGDQVAFIYGLDGELENENDRFQQLGYGSPYCVMNLGSMNLIIFISIFAVLIHSLMALCPAKCAKARGYGRK